MNSIKILSLFSIIFLLNISSLSAQSDYEIVSNFKKSLEKLENKIENVESASDLAEINAEVDKTISEFREHKTLLDKSLYPEDFNNSIEKVRTKIELKENDFTQLDELKTEVVLLRMNVDSISRKNSDLLSQLETLEKQSREDKSRIAQLERSISQLKISLQKRDELVMNMIDSLLPPSLRYQDELSSGEKQDIYSEAKRKNLVANINSAISDNIKFIEITSLNSNDIKEVKKQQEEFARVWKSSGPKIVDIYAEKGEDVNHLADIDRAFTRWNEAIEEEAWTAIRRRFEENNITLQAFSDGESFTAAVTSYIDDQIKSGSKDTYTVFTDSVWNKTIKPNWLPFLVSNNMLSDDQADRMDAKIDQWNEEEKPGDFNWLYIVLALLVIAIVVIFVVKRNSKQAEISEKRNEEDI